MIHGTGCDILRISRIAGLLSDPGSSFALHTFSDAERKLLDARPDPVSSYATHFAGKEAVFKAFGVPGDALRTGEIEILEEVSGRPAVHLHGKALSLSRELHITAIHLSLSYDTDYAVAFAVAECE
ncbi:MAG: holo-ACP synthase [Lachnospiraceae bacterium]|jgi:holo-[acyl-carrier protein] synthase|nr:holo-ACP synthase [Lachnospiraceae bacterium]